jgi:hypothetical protein
MELLELALSQNLPDIKTEDFRGKMFLARTFSQYPGKLYPIVYSSFNRKKNTCFDCSWRT